MQLLKILAFLALIGSAASAAEIHVSVKGTDNNDGSAGKPFRTISAAARVAQPGDVITVHAGTYRERVTPPRGGESDARRIVYQAAPGEAVVLKGSEVVRDWKPFAAGVILEDGLAPGAETPDVTNRFGIQDAPRKGVAH